MDAVLFDMDGTLLDTLDDLHASVNYALAADGLAPVSRDAVRLAAGYGSIVLMDELSAHAYPTDSPRFAQLLDTFAQHYNAHHDDATAPYAGIPELLAALDERGLAMAIVSNKVQRDTEELRQLYFAQHIGLAVGRTDERAPKPAPDMALAALEQLGVQAAATVFVGDSEPDVQMAQNAGCVSVACLWGFRSRACIEQLRPDFIVERPAQVLDVLDELER